MACPQNVAGGAWTLREPHIFAVEVEEVEV